MVEVPGTAPGSETAISNNVYYHSLMATIIISHLFFIWLENFILYYIKNSRSLSFALKLTSCLTNTLRIGIIILFQFLFLVKVFNLWSIFMKLLLYFFCLLILTSCTTDSQITNALQTFKGHNISLLAQKFGHPDEKIQHFNL